MGTMPLMSTMIAARRVAAVAGRCYPRGVASTLNNYTNGQRSFSGSSRPLFMPIKTVDVSADKNDGRAY
jgi:hypothetical protein